MTKQDIIERAKRVSLSSNPKDYIEFVGELAKENGTIPSDIQEAAEITPDEGMKLVDEYIHYLATGLKEGWERPIGPKWMMELAKKRFIAGVQYEHERLMEEIQKSTLEDGYIARDEKGHLVYSNRKLEREWDPERSDGYWYPDDDEENFDGMLCLPDKWFPEVRWADTPKKVKLIILK